MIGKVKAFAAGFLLGVFIAPRSGRASRRLLLERVNEFFEMGSRQLESLEDDLAGRRAVHRAGTEGPAETEPSGVTEPPFEGPDEETGG